MSKPKIREWIVTGQVTFDGATCRVMARTEEEALVKAANLDTDGDGVEISAASMVSWDFDECEINE